MSFLCNKAGGEGGSERGDLRVSIPHQVWRHLRCLPGKGGDPAADQDGPEGLASVLPEKPMGAGRSGSRAPGVHQPLGRHGLTPLAGSSHQQLLLAQEFQGHYCVSRTDREDTVEAECSLEERGRGTLVAPTTEAAAGHSFGPTPAHTHSAQLKKDGAQKSPEWVFYWIEPLLTVLEYDGKNLGTQGGLCQQPLFA